MSMSPCAFSGVLELQMYTIPLVYVVLGIKLGHWHVGQALS